MPKTCNAEHPTLDLKCSREPHDEGAHTATDADGNPHAWVTDAPADE